MSTNDQFKDLEAKLNKMVNYEERLYSAKEQSVGLPNYALLEELCSDFSAYKAEILKCFNDLKVVIQNSINKTDQIESYSRKNCLIVHGITESKDEEVTTVALKFLKDKLQLDVDLSSIDNCHRLNTLAKSKHPRPIIIKFTTYLIRSKVWSTKKLLKGTNYFISESLTRIRLNLYKKARESFGSKNAWTIDGRIIVLLPDGKKKTIETAVQLQDAERDRKAQLLNRPEIEKHTRGEDVKKKQNIYNTRAAFK